jgi:hypothetical protein
MANMNGMSSLTRNKNHYTYGTVKQFGHPVFGTPSQLINGCGPMQQHVLQQPPVGMMQQQHGFSVPPTRPIGTQGQVRLHIGSLFHLGMSSLMVMIADFLRAAGIYHHRISRVTAAYEPAINCGKLWQFRSASPGAETA